MLCRYTLVPGIGSAMSPETTKVAAVVATVRQLELEIDPPKKILFPFFCFEKNEIGLFCPATNLLVFFLEWGRTTVGGELVDSAAGRLDTNNWWSQVLGTIEQNLPTDINTIVN